MTPLPVRDLNTLDRPERRSDTFTARGIKPTEGLVVTDTAGTPHYTIQRAYLADDTTVAVGIQKDQLTVNIGEVALVMSPDLARKITSEIQVARLWHDMRYLEDDGRTLR